MDFQTFQDIVRWKQTDMDAIRARIREAVSAAPAHGAMRELLLECTGNSGKMLRPLMILMAAEDYAPAQREKLLWSAAAGEMLHTASLLLDDILDGADTRRGRPSVQSKYGESIALCAGNHLIATAYACLLDRGFPDVARDLMTVTQLVCDGEMLQDEYRWNPDIPEEVYLKSVTGKTAAVFAFACETASRITGHSEATQAVMRRFGETVGVMFQIRDDILDWTMDERKLGKPAGEDFLNGIYTLPVIRAFQAAETGDLLRFYVGQGRDISPESLEKAKELVASSGGLEAAKAKTRELAAEAAALLDALPAGPYTAALRVLVKLFTV